MPILSGDVKLLAAERLLDTPDGGGRMTGHVIVDGVSNNLFPDISELDRTYGRVSLRKAFVGVLTDSVDSYYGAHAIVADAPDDPRVSVALFTTRNWTDRRDAAKDRVERYLARGVKWPGQLLERQLTGQRAVSLLLKPSDPLPRVGQALVLVQDETKPTELEQYVRVTRVSTTTRDFTVNDGYGTVKFQGVICTCEISDPLRHDFEGPSPSARDDISARAVVRDTVVANAAMYYGIAATQASANIGDLTVQVNSLFGQLVPSAQSEIPLVDLNAAGQAVPLFASGAPVTWNPYAAVAPGRSLMLATPMMPGSLHVSGAGYEFTDAAGEIKSGATSIGTVNYERGVISFKDGAPAFTAGLAVRFTPAGAPMRVADTAAIAIAGDARGYAYTITLQPAPRPGSLVVSYMAQGRWYDLRDRGDGALRGADSSFGAGMLDYITGSVILTTGALPDANTDILFAWASGADYFERASASVSAPTLRHSLQDPGVVPGSLRLSWTDGAIDKLATDDGKGVVIGDAIGTISYARGELAFTPATLPAGGAEISVSYDWGPPQEASFPHPTRNADGTVTVTLPGPVKPGSVELEFNVLIEDYEAVTSSTVEFIPGPTLRLDPTRIARDVPDAGGATGTFGSGPDAVRGTIDYARGLITFTPETTVQIPKPVYVHREIGVERSIGLRGEVVIRHAFRYLFDHWEYIPAGALMPYDESGLVKVRYRDTDSASHSTETLTIERLEVDLTERYAERIVPGSVRFALGGKVYVDRLGGLVTDVDPNTGAGTPAGSIDYASGRTLVTAWQPGAPNTMGVQSLLTELGAQPVDQVSFRVPAAPVRPGSLQVRAQLLGGLNVNATADASGVITSDNMRGTIDYQSGVVHIRFGQRVPVAGNETQPWFNADAVEGTQVFKPIPVLADTIRFNAVSFSYLPLSADVLGLDPVRLPVDGRVPIFRPGDVAVVHHTASAPFAMPAKGGDMLDVGRVRLSSVRVLDADDKALPPERYASDLDLGRVTLKAPLDLSGYRQPLRAEHRVEDMALVSDTQINGVLTLTRPLTHAYPANESRVSSALIIGDLQARSHTLFSQQTWDGNWSNERIGGNTTAQYNAAVYPIDVSNRGAIEERWALIFSNTNEFRVVGESVGQIAIGNTAAGCSPTNPGTGAAYFVIKAGGWGAGWAAGNVLRFNTAAANYPVWIARTVLQGPSSSTADSFSIQIRGDIDR